jgi:gliding motility-associated-like protein
MNNGASWQPSSVFNGLAAANYTILVKDAHGCTANSSITVPDEPSPTVTTTPVTDVSCNTGSDGTITVNAIGGTGAIQYSIDNGVSYQSGNLFSGLPAGNYSITIQDANGCTATANTAITEPTPVLISLASQNSTCSQSNGSVTATAGGGTGAIQYSIDNGASWQASNVFNGLAAATYNILVQDANGCTATSSIAVPDEPSPTVSATPVTNVSCNTGSDGTITVNSIGGTGAIQYSIDNGVTYQPGNLFSGLPAGNYSITILDANGCTATANTVISEPPAIVLNASTVDATCNGSNGFINAGGNGGTGALQFSINGGLSFQPGGTFGGLPAGNYLITVQDANGCQDSIVASVSNAQAPVIASVLAVHVTCNSGNDGSVTINAVGGTGTLEYSIDNGNTFQAGNSFTGLPAGNYDVVVRDANGCLSTSGVQVTEPPALSLSAAPVTSTCGNSNGSITITAGGGTGSIQYSNDNGTAWQSSPAFGGLAAGSYAIVVQDDNGCTETMNVNVPGAPSPVIAAVPVTDVTCNSGTNGSIAINSNGGTGAIQYSIDNGVTFQAGNVFGGLQAGNYQVLIQDANGCTDATTAVIAEPTPLALSATSIDATCNGSNGTITVNGGGGTGSIQFSINGGVSFQPGTSFNGLMAGNYTIIAQDANGCIDSIAVVVNNALAPVIASVQLVDVTCHSGNNGSVTINANGGTGLLQYSIDNGNTFQGLNVFANLPAGIYDIAVRDANGCLATSSAQITEPDPVTFTASPATETCGDGNGSVTLSATGGTGTLQYSLDGGVTFQPQNQFTGLAAGNYQIVIQDANGCTASGSTLVSNAPSPTIVSVNTSNLICFQSGNGSITITASGGSGSLQFSINGGINSQAGGNFTNLAAGNYSLVVTDTNGCEAISSAIITQPDPVVFSASTIQALCGGSNGSISLSASGGVGNYLFSIDSGMTFQPGSVFTGLASGNYQVFVQDNSGCTASGMVPVSNAQAPVITSTALHDASCYGMNDGEITIVASGGSGALSYSINGGVTWQLGNLFANIPAGTYSIVVADTNGCLATSPAVIAEPPQIVFSSVTVGSTCGNADGSVTLTASGGTGILQYSIDGGNTMQSASVFSNIGAGNYSIVIQDATGCLANGIASVSNTNGPVITVTVPSGLTCFGSNDGSISVVANGGVGTLNYSIDNGVTFQASGTFAGLAGGTYAIVVLDSNNCIATDGVLIHEPDPVQFNTLVTDATCGDLNGVIEVIATGGTGTLQFSNNNGTAFQQDTIFMNLSPGNYFMVVQDANGCSVTSQVSVADLASPVISLVNTTDVSCHGGNDGAATIGISGGTAPFLYQWSNAAASQLIGGITAGNYTVTVTDANHCTVTQVLTITEPSQLTAVTLSTPVNCYGWHNGSLSATPAGGTAPYYYLWSTGWAGQTESGLGAGVYSVIITDDHGCTVSVTDSVATPSVVTISSSAVHVDCAGNNNGSVHTMVTGGTAPYTYLWSTGATTSSINGLPGGTYQVTVTDDHNCIKYKITGVSEPPPLVLNVSQPDTICITQQATIWAAASGGTAPYTYQWSNNQSVNMQTVAPSATATYLVHVTDANGCTVPNQPVTVYVNPPLVVVASPDDAICDGEHLSIAAVASGGNGGPYAYSWSNGAGTNSSTLVSPQQTTTYIVTVTDQCGTPQAMDDVTVTVHPMPQVAFSLNPPSGCIPLEVSFVDQSVTDAGSHYVWDFGDGHYDTMYVNPVHTYYEPGTYSVGLTITTPFGCTSELVKPDVIQAWPLPVAGFTPDPAKTSILDPRIQFSDQSQGATQWRWEFGDLYGSSTEQFPVHIYRDTGTYQVTQFVLNQYGCRDTAYGEVVILGDFTIYVPNAFTPNGDGVNEYFFPQGIGITGLSMLIFDRWGQQVFATGSMTNPWDGTNNRDNSQCVQDVYVYLIRATDLHGRGHEFTGRVSLIR